MKKALFFDLDGTLIDSERFYLEGTYRWMSEKGFAGTAEDLYGTVGVTFDEAYRLMQKYLPQFTVEEIRRFNEDYFLNRDPLRYRDLLFPDTDGILKELAKDYMLCLCSNDPRRELDRFQSECGYEDLFTLVLSCEDIKNAKPDPEIFLKARDLLGLKNEDCLIVEDSDCGIAAGKAAGIYTVARKCPFPVDQSAADRLLGSLSELTEVLKEFYHE